MKRFVESLAARRHALVLLALSLPLAAEAGDDAHCRRVREQAAVEAARLMSPQLLLQGMRYPRSLYVPLADLDTLGSGYQARAALVFSPLELAQGVVLTRASELECARFESEAELLAFVEHAEGSARLPALRRQLEYLDAHTTAWRTLVERAETRYAGRLITVFELNQVRVRAGALERSLLRARGDAERLEALQYQRPAGSVNARLEGWLDHSLSLERQQGLAKSLRFWNVRLTAGLVASDRPVDWYGLAELSFHLGTLFEGEHGKQALEAHARELQTTRTGVAHRLRELQRRLGLLQSQTRLELELLESQLTSLDVTQKVLERSDSANAEFALALLTFDRMLAESEKAYLSTLLGELSTLLQEDAHG